MAIQITDVQKALAGADYPATGPDLAALARRNGGGNELVSCLEGIDDQLSGPDQVMHALKGSLTEGRPS